MLGILLAVQLLASQGLSWTFQMAYSKAKLKSKEIRHLVSGHSEQQRHHTITVELGYNVIKGT
jgi:hypothetical protein